MWATWSLSHLVSMQCVLVAVQYICVAKRFSGDVPAASLAHVKNPVLVVE